MCLRKISIGPTNATNQTLGAPPPEEGPLPPELLELLDELLDEEDELELELPELELLLELVTGVVAIADDD